MSSDSPSDNSKKNVRRRRKRTSDGSTSSRQRPSSSESDSSRKRERSRDGKRRKSPPRAMRSKAKKSRFTQPIAPKEPLWLRIQRWFDVSEEPELTDHSLRMEANTRLKYGGISLVLGLSVLVMRAGYLMLWPNPMLEEVTKIQYENTEIIRGRRGDIVD